MMVPSPIFSFIDNKNINKSTRLVFKVKAKWENGIEVF